MAGEELTVIEEVFESESDTNYNNRGIANVLYSGVSGDSGSSSNSNASGRARVSIEPQRQHSHPLLLTLLILLCDTCTIAGVSLC